MCDFVVTVSAPVAAGTLGLYGQYGTYEEAYLNPADLAAGEDVLLIHTMLDGRLGDVDSYLDLEYLVNSVVEFDCGIFNLSQDNIDSGLVVTVTLVSWDSSMSYADAVAAGAVRTITSETYTPAVIADLIP